MGSTTALDEIGIFLQKPMGRIDGSGLHQLYEYLTSVVSQILPALARFSRLAHGNRRLFEDPNARGMFFSLNGQDGARSVLEGVYAHALVFGNAG